MVFRWVFSITGKGSNQSPYPYFLGPVPAGSIISSFPSYPPRLYGMVGGTTDTSDNPMISHGMALAKYPLCQTWQCKKNKHMFAIKCCRLNLNCFFRISQLAMFADEGTIGIGFVKAQGSSRGKPMLGPSKWFSDAWCNLSPEPTH